MAPENRRFGNGDTTDTIEVASVGSAEGCVLEEC